MPKKIKLFLNSEQKVSKLIFGVLMVGLAVLITGSGVFAYFQRTASDSNFNYGYGYGYDGSNYGYGYGYGYGANVSGYNDYGFWGVDGKATSVSAASLGSSGVSVSYTNSYYAKNKIYYGTASATCASLGSNTTQTSFQTGSQSTTISNLTCGTTYYYCVASEDAGSNTWYTSVGSVSTSNCGGGTGGTGGSVTPPTTEIPAITTQTTVGTISASGGGNITLTTSEGSKAEVVIPAGATTANLSVTVQSKSAATLETAGTVGVAPSAMYRVGNLVFEVSATNASTSAAVTQFSKDITLSFTYTDAQIAGLNEDTLKIYTWDGTAWLALESVVDKTNNKVTANVSHLSYFTIMGQKTSTTTAATTTVTITKPITQMTMAELKAKIQEVLNLLIGLVTQLINQWQSQLQAIIAGQPTGQTATSTLTSLDTNLKYGNTGEAVRLLQIWLAKDKAIYPEGSVSGTFGSATKSAVIRFQEKYTDEILKPAGLTKGNGLVGANTRTKLNALYGSQQIANRFYQI